MYKRIILLMAAALALLSAVGQVTFSGWEQGHDPIPVTPENGTDLKHVYVIYNTDGVAMTYTATTSQPVTWYSYDYRGGSLHIEPINGIVRNGTTTTLSQVLPNTGYKIVEGTRPYYCWVVNYDDYRVSLNDIDWDNEVKCDLLNLKVDGIARKIRYYDVNGRSLTLDRELELHYSTLVWDEGDLNTPPHWRNNDTIATFESLDNGIQIDQPLCNTDIWLSGDRFLKQWDEETETPSRFFEAYAVQCATTAKDLDTDSIDLSSGPTLSAPVRILFTGYPTDAVVYRAWEIDSDPEFGNPMQFYQDVLEYTFNDPGTYYVRYSVDNNAGTCPWYSQTYQFTVSVSSLECPNIFTPNGDTIHDTWKVRYKSLSEFHCWIFNRWGNLVYEFTSPDGEWDGTYKGQPVDTGVYFYVITAKGTDGVSYKKRGDINILRESRNSTPSGNGSGGF